MLIEPDAQPLGPGWKITRDHPITLRCIEIPRKIEITPCAADTTIESCYQKIDYLRLPGGAVADFLLQNQVRISQAWEEYKILFLGTGYRGPSSGRTYVRFIVMRDALWTWGVRDVMDTLDETFAIAKLKDVSAT